MVKGRRFRYVAFRLEAGPGAAAAQAPDDGDEGPGGERGEGGVEGRTGGSGGTGGEGGTGAEGGGAGGTGDGGGTGGTGEGGGTGGTGDGGTGPVTFRDLVGELRRMDRGDDAWLVEFDGTHGIVRCPHTAKEATIALLSGMDRVGDVPVDIETLGTSGTIRRCCAKFLP